MDQLISQGLLALCLWCLVWPLLHRARAPGQDVSDCDYHPAPALLPLPRASLRPQV